MGVFGCPLLVRCSLLCGDCETKQEHRPARWLKMPKSHVMRVEVVFKLSRGSLIEARQVGAFLQHLAPSR